MMLMLYSETAQHLYPKQRNLFCRYQATDILQTENEQTAKQAGDNDGTEQNKRRSKCEERTARKHAGAGNSE